MEYKKILEKVMISEHGCFQYCNHTFINCNIEHDCEYGNLCREYNYKYFDMNTNKIIKEYQIKLR